MKLKKVIEYQVLELTPPAFMDKDPEATSELFSVIHGLNLVKSTRFNNQAIAFEIVSTRAEGIRYMVRIDKTLVDQIEHIIHAYLPEVQIRKIDDYLTDNKQSKIIEFKQTKHFAYPLNSFENLETLDPISYLTSTMTKLNDNEMIIYQVVISSAVVKSANDLYKKVLANENLSPDIDNNRPKVVASGLRIIGKTMLGFTELLTEAIHGTSNYQVRSSFQDLAYDHQAASKVRPARLLSKFEQEHIESISNKLKQSMFKVGIRVLISTNEKREANKKAKAIKSAMAIYSVPGYQSLATVSHNKRFYQHHIKFNILSLSEVASLYHFPNSKSAKTENIIKSLNKTLPATVSLKNGTKLDVMLGVNKHHGSVTSIGLTEDERQRHVYILGGTGNGKTTMLQYMAVQDINNGKGIAIIDPHGDFAETMLKHIPRHRIKDVIYINPDDIDYPISVNLLELPEDLEGSELEREKDRITESVISVFRKIFSDDDSGGHRIEYILRNSIQTALMLEDSTIFTVFELLTNDDYRKKITRGLPPGTLKNFWKNELGKAGNMQRVKMAQGVTSKIGRFEFSVATKRVMGNHKSTVDFDDIINSRKILICNFSKGRLGEDTSALFGTAILAKLQIATNRRDKIDQKQRIPFYLYVDEFQNFATMPFLQMLSEARKYKLFLTMAEQTTSQQEEGRMVNIILANVGTVVCFRTGSPIDENLVLPLFKPFIGTGEIASLSSYNFYMRVSAVEVHEPISGETVLLDDYFDINIANLVKANSRTNFGQRYKDERSKLIEKISVSNTRTFSPLTDEPLEA